MRVRKRTASQSQEKTTILGETPAHALPLETDCYLLGGLCVWEGGDSLKGLDCRLLNATGDRR